MTSALTLDARPDLCGEPHRPPSVGAREHKMIHRLAVNLLLAAALFVAPLGFRLELLTHLAPWLGFGVALIVMLSQPAARFRETRDRHSALGIFASMSVAQLAAVIEFGFHGGPRPAWLIVGAGVSIVGLALRLWAIRALGRFFTSEVRVVSDQTVVCGGPYRCLRHPSYTGALLAAAGVTLALGSVMGLALVAALCVPAYLYRIAVEENALIAELGAAYADYRRRSWGLVPGVR